MKNLNKKYPYNELIQRILYKTSIAYSKRELNILKEYLHNFYDDNEIVV